MYIYIYITIHCKNISVFAMYIETCCKYVMPNRSGWSGTSSLTHRVHPTGNSQNPATRNLSDSFSLHMYIYTHIYIYIHTHTHMYIYNYIYIYIYQIQHRISLSAPFVQIQHRIPIFFKKIMEKTQTMEMWLLCSGSPRWPPPRRPGVPWESRR